MSDEVIAVEGNELREEALSWPAKALALTISNADTYVSASDMLRGIKALANAIDEKLDPNIARWHAGHKASVAEKASMKAPLTEAEGIIKRALAAYEQEQQRIARAEADRLAAIARQAEMDRKLAEAVAAEAQGDDVAACAILDEPLVSAPVFVPAAVPKVAGVSYRTTYAARVTDKTALVKFCASNPQFLHCVMPDMTALNALARSMKTNMQIPGVTVDESRSVAVGR
jgi:regulator of protease activity HflC (stomatin/prohibitin superfamily)